MDNPNTSFVVNRPIVRNIFIKANEYVSVGYGINMNDHITHNSLLLFDLNKSKRFTLYTVPIMGDNIFHKVVN